MKNAREDTPTINLSAQNGIPQVSFGTAAGDRGRLMAEEYSIAGNEFVAYYDGAHKLIFVLDNTVDSRKPNVLLVINSVDDRKWDDILANDYNVDLETVRPKKDNKYQKLDIEYDGLSVYNSLINEYNNGADLTVALAELSNFRNASVRRAAADRLIAAEDTIVTTRETISKTGETMRELQARLKKLREKLAQQKKALGKEPAKQSAAKILKTESQIDDVNEKLRRAKKRLSRAQSRLATAEEDAEIARRILAQKESVIQIPQKEIKVIEKPKAKVMAEEVKPLFDQDPEILDDKIAFKPIDFGATPVSEPEPIYAPVQNVTPEPAPEPLSFVPPVTSHSFDAPTPIEDTPPVLNTITTVEEPTPMSVAPAPEPTVPPVVPTTTPAPVAAPRPVSPITGGSSNSYSDGGRHRPTALYYIMLILLIALSVFTLWLYQKNTGDTVPVLTVPTEQPIIVEEMPEPIPVPEVVESPFIDVEPAVIEEPVFIPEPVVEPEPIFEPEPEIITRPIISEEPAPAPAPNKVVNKPAYDVSGQQMFVADAPYYEEEVFEEDPNTVYEAAPEQPEYMEPEYTLDHEYEEYESYESYQEYYDDEEVEDQYM